MHDKILYNLIFVLLLVLWVILRILTYLRSASNFKIIRTIVLKGSIHGKLIELLWTITPGIILLFIAIPSYKLLYIMDLIIDPVVTVKGIGRQWFWQYDYSNDLSYHNDNSNSNTITIDCYGKPIIDQPMGGLHLANADTPVVLPIDNVIRLLTTSGDVIHSLAVPCLGIKGDAIPGRLNGVSVLINRTGSFYGQCSELCGVNHAFMPINLVGVDIYDYLSWYSSILINY